MAYDPNDPKDKEIVDGLIAEATAALTAKRDELLSEVRELKKNRGKDADPQLRADLDRAEAKLAEVEAKLTAAEQKAAKAERERDKANETVANTKKTNESLVSQNAIKDAMAAHKIADKLRNGVVAMLSQNVKVTEVDGKLVAQIDGKSVDDYMKEWTASDEGKAYVAAPNSGGGGAPGSDQQIDPAKTKTRAEFDALAPEAKMAWATTPGNQVVDAAPG